MARPTFAVLFTLMISPLLMAQRPQSRATDPFTRFDRDRDGFLSREEMPPQFPAERFRMADSDGDGKLSREEEQSIRRNAQSRDRQRERPQSRPGSNLPTPDFANAAYGPHERNVFDLWKAKSDTPTPLVIFYHGGGFRSGDKGQVRPELIAKLHAEGISVAAANYRLTRTAPFPAQMHDSARALQFIRLHAGEYNIDPTRIGATGGSAGAGISQWLAFHDDLADPHAQDPVLRQSTRLRCVAVTNAQTSYDPRFMMKLFQTDQVESAIFAFFGLNSPENVNNPQFFSLFEEASPITHLTADDPPVMLSYSQSSKPLPPNSSGSTYIHHPAFGFALKEKMDALGIECTVYTPENRQELRSRAAGQDETIDFFVRHLK